MIPIVFQLGPVPLYSFGAMVVLGFLGAWRVLVLRLSREGEPIELAERMVFWGAVGGLVGARLTYILSFPSDLIADPIGTIFSSAGFVFYGGFIVGAISVVVLLRSEKKNVLRFADFSAPALAVGYAIGRVGCHLSGDGDYGIPSTLPWAFSYQLGIVPTEPGVLVHPTPIYETLLSLLLASLLLSRFGIGLSRGIPFIIFLLVSSVSRFFVEFLRIEPVVTIGQGLILTQAQIVSVLLIFFGLALYVKLQGLHK